MDHLNQPNREFYVEFAVMHYNKEKNHVLRVELEPVMGRGGVKGWRPVRPADHELHENMLFDREMARHERTVTEYDALHIFRGELPALCWDHIGHGDDPDFWHALLAKGKRQQDLKFEDRKKRAKEVPIRHLAEKFGFHVRLNKINCPFHEDSSASCHLYERENRFHCFGCQASGDPIDFLQQKLGCDFMTALDYLIP